MKVSPTPATPSTTSRRDITSSLLPTTSAPWVRTSLIKVGYGYGDPDNGKTFLLSGDSLTEYIGCQT
jgi:hypothetical protein